MKTLIKLLIGVILLVVPLGMYAYELLNGVEQGVSIPILGTVYLWRSLVIILLGIIPPFIMLIGLFVIWLELDEWRIERELKKEESEEKEDTSEEEEVDEEKTAKKKSKKSKK